MTVTVGAGEAGWPPRVIIAIDIDCFYVACERHLNPSLIGKAVGVQQKHILATCSYEARAFGVGKLQNVKEAMRLCPELILVSGEDLTHYRRFSRAITRLVKAVIWDRKVERLGMDELFCDATDMVTAHLVNLGRKSVAENTTKRFFSLSKDPACKDQGFWYDSTENPSLVIPQESASSDAQYSPALRAAAHLAAYIRGRLHKELGFTTSAGIAHNKIFGKLVASLNKPALQTTWSPDVRRARAEQMAFISGFQLRQIQGFGGAICSTISAHMRDILGCEESSISLTTALVRQHCTQADFERWFSPKLAKRLWQLLFGDDHEPVNPSPEYPVQISVEDSHIGISTMRDALKELQVLALHLLQRLEEELTEAPDGSSLVSEGPSATKPLASGVKWAQYPTSLRLTVRQGYERTRETKTTAFPMDAIDERLPIDVRAERLIKGHITSLLKQLLKTTANDVSCYITILNICATNFSTSRPNPTLQNALSRKPVAAKLAKSEAVDLTLLPSDEVPDTAARTQTTPPIWVEDDEASEKDEVVGDDLVFVGEHRPALITCKDCGSRLFSFSAAAHRAYHESEHKAQKRHIRRKGAG